ncbi:YihY family inner membrane protein [bacterium]|nr:YihY family inner membrane protein [bacterium]
MSTRIWKRALLYLERLRREIAYDDCMGMAAQIAYYMLLSVIPFFIFVLSIISRLSVGEALAPLLLDALREQMPLEAANFIVDIVLRVLPTQSSETTVVSFVIALWGSSMAIGALITTINRAYNLRPRRNIVVQKLLSILLVLVLSAVLMVALLILLFGPQVTQETFEFLGLASETNTFWTSMRLPLATLLAFSALCILYYYAPEARQRFVHILPGAVTATLLWLVASAGFRLFVRNFGNYNATYGSLAAVVILLAFFWLTGFIFLLGAEINALMKRLEVEEGRSLFRPLR